MITFLLIIGGIFVLYLGVRFGFGLLWFLIELICDLIGGDDDHHDSGGGFGGGSFGGGGSSGDY